MNVTRFLRFIAHLVVFSVFMGTAVCSLATTSAHGFADPEFERLYDETIVWLGKSTRYSVERVVRPELRFVTEVDLIKMKCDDMGVPLENCHARVPVAGYDNGVMWATMGFDPVRDGEDRLTLVHELVHHLQQRSSTEVEFDCAKHIEYEAYATEFRYAKEHGLIPKTHPGEVKLLKLPCSNHL